MVEASTKSDLLVLFGPGGSGKNYIGDLLQERFGYKFYDADSDQTPEKLEAAKNRQPFTIEMQEKFFGIVFARVGELITVHQRLVVANAFVNDRFRQEMLDRFPQARFLLVQASDETRLQRASARIHDLPGDYIAMINRLFEPPTIPHMVIHNDHGNDLINQLNQIVSKNFTSQFSY